MITGRDPAAREAFAAELAGIGTEVRFYAVDLADPLASAGSATGAVASYEIAEFCGVPSLGQERGGHRLSDL